MIFIQRAHLFSYENLIYNKCLIHTNLQRLFAIGTSIFQDTMCFSHGIWNIIYWNNSWKIDRRFFFSIAIMTFRGFIILYRSVTRNFADSIDILIINKPWNKIHILKWHEITKKLQTCYKYFESCLKVILSLRCGRANFIVSRINYSSIISSIYFNALCKKLWIWKQLKI